MKKWHIATVAVFVLGIGIGGGLEHKRFAKSMETFEYKSEVPIRAVISDQELEAKPKLVELMKNYGQITEDSKAMEPEYHEIKEKALQEILPKGSNIIRFQNDCGNIDLMYKVDGSIYRLYYENNEVYKASSLKYKNREYDIDNMNNKDIKYTRAD